MKFLTVCVNGGAPGTGISKIIDIGRNIMGHDLPDVLVDYNVGIQNVLMGGYPTRWDIAPASVFAVVFFIFLIIHTAIFLINFFRGHYFWVSLGFIAYCLMKVPAFAMRAYWGTDITLINIGLAGSVLQIVPAYLIVSLNLILTQRLFTWRHPVGGSRWLFWNIMILMYIFVFIFIAIIVTASLVPYLHFLSYRSYEQWAQVNMGCGVIVVLYVMTSVSLLGLSYLFPPTKKDENLYTYQPWWIKSFSPFYFVEKGAAQRAELTFMRRNHNHRHAIRVIAATHHHFNMVEGLTNERGSLTHNISMLIITATTALILVGAILRCVVLFQFKWKRYESTVAEPLLGYITWGVFESLVNIIYIVGRVDLRFYRPDILPPQVRAIITAEQSFYPSESEDEEDIYTRSSHESDVSAASKVYSSDLPLSYDKVEPPYPTDDVEDLDDDRKTTDSSSFRFPLEKQDEKKDTKQRDDDDDSVFHF